MQWGKGKDRRGREGGSGESTPGRKGARWGRESAWCSTRPTPAVLVTVSGGTQEQTWSDVAPASQISTNITVVYQQISTSDSGGADWLSQFAPTWSDVAPAAPRALSHTCARAHTHTCMRVCTRPHACPHALTPRANAPTRARSHTHTNPARAHNHDGHPYREYLGPCRASACVPSNAPRLTPWV